MVDGSLVHCHGVLEFTVTVPCFFYFIFSLIYLFLIYRYNSHHFQTILVAEYRFNDSEQCIPYGVDAFRGISQMHFRV